MRDFDRVFWITLAAFAAATLLAYQPAWHGGFLWDDNGHVTKPVLQPLGGLWRIWFVPGATQQFYPVVHSAFWLQFHLWGLNSTGYHIVNILLHAYSAALLVAILRPAAGARRRAGRRDQQYVGEWPCYCPVWFKSTVWCL